MRWQNWLLLAALADWLIERTLSRAAIFMPKTGAMVTVVQGVMSVGQVAFNLSAILTLAVTAWLAIRGWGRTERHLPLSIALAGLIGLSVAGVIVPPNPVTLLIFHALTLVALGSLVVKGVRARSSFRWRLAIVLPALAIGSVTLFKIDETLGLMLGRSDPPSIAIAAYQIGEWFVVLTPLAVGWAYGGGRRARSWIIAAIPAVLFSIGFAANPSLTATMATWSLGLSLYLPWPAYAISLWLATLTAVRAVRAGHPTGYGLIFLTAAGYSMQLSSQVMLALLGVWMLGRDHLPDLLLRPMPVGQSEASPVAS